MNLIRKNLGGFSKLKTLLANEVIPKYKERKPLVEVRAQPDQEGPWQQGHRRGQAGPGHFRHEGDPSYLL